MHTEPAPVAAHHPNSDMRWALASLTIAALALLGLDAIAQPVRPIAFATAAADRETLRMQILVEERQTQRERLVEARMRLAERLQSGDAKGIEDARRVVTRIEDALDSLGRELERQPARIALRPNAAVAPATAFASRVPSPVTPRPPAPFVPVTPTPWWDVYGADARPRSAAVPAPAADPSQP